MQARPKGRVPVPTATIVGRDRLTDDVVDLVLANRMVTLTGVGGVGKTRLAIEVAQRLASQFADGVHVVELAGVGEPSAVPGAIANTLGITPQGDRPMIDTLAEAVAGRELLLVIDNCEHVATAAATIIEGILGRSSTPRVLATSRENLWVAGEQRVAVSPLSLAGDIDSDAVRLFVERAGVVRLGFAVEEAATGAAVVEICRSLDGLPLAIELAAARMASMTAIELRDRLGHRFRLLRGAEHRPERHRSLAEMVAWSYDLLHDDGRTVLGAASVFAGGFDLTTLSQLMDEPDEVGVLAQLDALVNQSLVVATQRDGATRYHLLETIRQFAVDRLADEHVLESWRDRHAALLADHAAAWWDRWNGPDWQAASDWIAAELDNLRAAYRWSMARGHIVVATDVAAHAALIGTAAQQFEPVTWAEDLLDTATRADVVRLPRLYTGAGYACFTGRPVSAAEHAHTATQLETQAAYDSCEPGLATFVEALARVYSGDLDRYVELARRVAGLPGSARAYGLPAYVDGLQASGRVDEALALVEESIAAAVEVGNPFWIAYAQWTAGLALANRDPTKALASWAQGVDVVREHGVTFFEGFLARDAARLHTLDGEPEEALGLFATAIESFRHAGNVAQLIITVSLVPRLFERMGRRDAAATLRAAIMREGASLDHVPDLAELGERLEIGLGPEAFARCHTAGSELDLAAAAGYALTQIERARAQLAQALTDEPPAGLSRRELEVLELVADGLTTREIAERLFISAKTADHHIQHIYTKTGVSNRAAATRWAIDHGVTPGGADSPEL